MLFTKDLFLILTPGNLLEYDMDTEGVPHAVISLDPSVAVIHDGHSIIVHAVCAGRSKAFHYTFDAVVDAKRWLDAMDLASTSPTQVQRDDAGGAPADVVGSPRHTPRRSPTVMPQSHPMMSVPSSGTVTTMFSSPNFSAATSFEFKCDPEGGLQRSPALARAAASPLRVKSRPPPPPPRLPSRPSKTALSIVVSPLLRPEAAPEMVSDHAIPAPAPVSTGSVTRTGDVGSRNFFIETIQAQDLHPVPAPLGFVQVSPSLLLSELRLLLVQKWPEIKHKSWLFAFQNMPISSGTESVSHIRHLESDVLRLVLL
jgi:hypothetical protein